MLTEGVWPEVKVAAQHLRLFSEDNAQMPRSPGQQGMLMKLIFCRKCKDVFKLTRKESRECTCGAVRGRYLDRSNAVVSPNAVSIAIGNGSLKKAIAQMEKLRGNSKNTATRDDYKKLAKISRAWVRPNDGPGNPHTELKKLGGSPKKSK